MNYYIISYDVINADDDRNGDVLDSLIAIVSMNLGGEVTNRPVASTLIFTSNYSFEEVRPIIFNWSQSQRCYYAISQIANDASSGVNCRIVANEQLESSLVAIKKEKRS